MTPSSNYFRLLSSLLVTFLLLMPVGASEHEAFKVKSVNTRLNGNVYFLNAVFDIHLPSYILSAFEEGFDLPLSMEIEIFEYNKFWLDTKIVAIKQSYLITYQALLDRVSVLDINAGSHHYYASLKDALASQSVLLEYPLLDKNPLNPDERYNARLRFGIDEAQLPVPLKTSVLWKNNWSLVSDWVEWGIDR